ARRNQTGIVIGPRRAREIEEALAFFEAPFRVWVGVEEDVAMIECGDQFDVAREQHPVAEDVARHVAYPGHGEIVSLRVDAHLAEAPFDRLPRAARGDAHRLVVVAGGAARGEGVAQPEAVFLADRVGVIREGGSALVGGDDQIRIVFVVAPELRRRLHPALYPLVLQVEQSAQVVLITFHALFHVSLAVGLRGRALEHETAFRPDWHDDGVLDHLRFDQSQYLGAEILRAVRPSQASARHTASAQVYAL